MHIAHTARSWLFRLGVGLAAALALAGSARRPPVATEPAPELSSPLTHDAQAAARHVDLVLRRDAAHYGEAERALIRDEVVAAALHSDVDPLLVLALMRLESGFRGDVVSRNGAQGLMQLQPATARWIAARVLASPEETEASALDLRTNIRLGVGYFSYLFRRFGSFALSLEAYNRGPNAPDLYRKSVDEGQLPDRFWQRVLAQYFEYRRLVTCADDACALQAPWAIGLSRHELAAFFSLALPDEELL